MTVLAQTGYVTGRHLRFFFRQPWLIGMMLLQPIIWLLLFGAPFKSVANIPGFAGGSYLDYLMPGVLVMTALFGCGWSGMQIVQDLDRSIMDRLLTTPTHRSAIIIGLNLYELFSMLVGALIIGGLALLLGARYPGGFAGFAVLTFCAMLVGAIAAALSDAMALTVRQGESVIGINTLMTLPLTFLSAAFMPLNLAPDWIATAARFNPVNWAVEAGREAMTASPDWSLILPRVGALLILTVLSTALATRAFGSYQRSL